MEIDLRMNRALWMKGTFLTRTFLSLPACSEADIGSRTDWYLELSSRYKRSASRNLGILVMVRLPGPTFRNVTYWFVCFFFVLGLFCLHTRKFTTTELFTIIVGRSIRIQRHKGNVSFYLCSRDFQQGGVQQKVLL